MIQKPLRRPSISSRSKTRFDEQREANFKAGKFSRTRDSISPHSVDIPLGDLIKFRHSIKLVPQVKRTGRRSGIIGSRVRKLTEAEKLIFLRPGRFETFDGISESTKWLSI